MDKPIDILDHFAKRTIAYLKDNLGMDELDTNYSIASVEYIEYEDITALIDLEKDLQLTMGISLSADIAFEVVKSFIYGDIDDETLRSLANENLAETLNIIAGHLISDLQTVKEGGEVDITTPYETLSKRVEKKSSDSFIYLCKIKYHEKFILLSLYN
jgi:CheY-specific phosphatase CheX